MKRLLNTYLNSSIDRLAHFDVIRVSLHLSHCLFYWPITYCWKPKKKIFFSCGIPIGRMWKFISRPICTRRGIKIALGILFYLFYLFSPDLIRQTLPSVIIVSVLYTASFSSQPKRKEKRKMGTISPLYVRRFHFCWWGSLTLWSSLLLYSKLRFKRRKICRDAT